MRSFLFPPSPDASCRTDRSSISTILSSLYPFQKFRVASFLLLATLGRTTSSRVLSPLAKHFRFVLPRARLPTLASDLAEKLTNFLAWWVISRHIRIV